MGEFSTLNATNDIPVKGKLWPHDKTQASELVTVTKYGWSFIMKVLCSNVTGLIPVLRNGYSDDDPNPLLIVIKADIRKGISHYEKFFPELHRHIDIPNFNSLFDRNMLYLKKLIKFKTFVLDSREFYGMTAVGRASWDRYQISLAKECKETLNGASFIVYKSAWKKWFTTEYAPKKIAEDMEWMVDFSAKRQSGW